MKPGILEATFAFEKWLVAQLPIIKQDLRLKHQFMAEAASCLRVQDPFVRFHNRWLVRRIAPDCSRIELASLAAERDEARLLYSMGWETANMHFGSPQAIPQIKRDLAKRKTSGCIEQPKRCAMLRWKTGQIGARAGRS
ncbi:MAG: hypothetical protein WBR10_05465 [Candidatus Acidiferrum sp.]